MTVRSCWSGRKASKVLKRVDKGPTPVLHDRDMRKQIDGNNEYRAIVLSRENGVIMPNGGNMVDLFDKFWLTYPNKKAKGAAKKAFDKIKPDESLLKTMLLAIDAQKREKKRKQDNNLFAPEWPMPATWLNGLRWEDEVVSNEEIQRQREAEFCKCGAEARHKRDRLYCDACFMKMMDDNSGHTEKLRESYKKLPKKKDGESNREWAERLMNDGKYGNILKPTSQN